ncbi:DUF615 domain-containing protein [Burkholderiaceae bacterium FT117]|uniref:ribosome biogenesis factor YjgA n=1 Tax=Zeimonas sediminis TaxID=2944268 RepID=UPI0023431CF2|nr:ribosome biogenesis factor YjgA [Zeimonas sediminis]MCM5572005.1 DUF615 domain-containing protein [Zeimonas sediminis]
MSASRRNTRGAERPEPPTDERPSKSQRKRDAHALQQLGERLVTLRDDVLVRLPIGEELIEAVRMAREIRSHEGRRRQVQLIGKLMRDADGDAIRAALSDEGREHRTTVAVQHAAERWRERILADERVLANWQAEYPDSRDAIAALVPRARAELAAGGPGRAYRELYRKLRAELENTADRSETQ